jgi:3-oxoadipate enol-lactonase
VLLHGLGTGPGAWQRQVEAFSASRPVLAPHLRLGPAFRIEAEADALWRSLDARDEVDLCGLSLGALVALRAALDWPSRVHRLVLCAGFARLPRSLRLLQATLGAAATVLPERTLRELLLAAVPESARSLARCETAGLDRRTIRAVFRAGRRFDSVRELNRLTMPVLLLVGERDRPNLSLSRALGRRLSSAELQVIAGAGHVANLDAPESFNRALARFLD